MTTVAAASAASSTASSSSSSSSSDVVDTSMIANNFNTFLTLLTTQLQNQNPLDPLDTNQFTQQLVQFAQVEQQMKSNSELNTLVALQQTQQASTALSFIGQTVVVDGSTTNLANSSASWNLNVSKPATANVLITDSTGQTAYSGTLALSPGNQAFTWDGHGNDGRQWADGNYKITVTAVDANQQSVAVSTEAQGVVDSVDLTQSPAVLSINGQDYTLDKIKRIVRS